MLPTFLIIGAGRSGTTSLHAYLDQHPDIFMSPIKEPNYFSLTGSVAGPYARALRRRSASTLAEYEALFSGAGRASARGEASPSYLRSPVAAERIREAIPGARLVAILRHPVERAYASYLAARRDGFEPAPTFEAAIASCLSGEREAWDFLRYTQSGYYHQHLSRYLARFPREQIRVDLHEDLHRDAGALIRQMLEFIGVDPTFPIDTSERFGRTGTIANPALRFVWRHTLPLRNAVEPIVPKPLRERAKAIATRKMVTPPMGAEARATLLRIYRDDTLRLQDLLQRDLSTWLR